MPIEGSAGTLDIENATLRSNAIAVLTNLVTGNDRVRESGAPALEVYGDPSNGGNEARLELVSNTAAVSSSAFTRLTSNAGVFSIKTGTDASDNGTITFGGFANERMRIGSDGKVGIGTNGPEVPLNVVGNNALSGTPNNTIASFRATTAVPGTNDAGVVIGSINGNTPYIADVSSASVGLSFYTQNNHRMRILANGNVGIGTTNPTSIFNTYGGDLWDGSSMASKVCATLQVGRGGGVGASANDIGFGGILEFRHHSDSRFVTIESVSEATYSASIGLRFKTHGGAGDGERMRIDGAGNVGIGTTNPDAKLTLNAYGDENTTDCFIIGANTASQNLRLGVNSVDQYCWIQSHAGKPLRLNPSGNTVQYGTTNTTLSDDRIKDNEVYIENATDTLLKLKPQVYDKKLIWNISKLGETSNTSIVRESGLITQDVWYDAPELRHLVQLGEGAEPGDDKPYTDNDPTNDPDYSSWGDNVSLLDYIGLIPYLIKSNQELHTELQTFKARLDTLEGA